jgi:hypothetical protein
MIEFVLAVYIGATLTDQTQRFADIDQCLYFANRLNNQPRVPITDGRTAKITAVCKPRPKLRK